MTNYSKRQNLTKDDINIINNDISINNVQLGGHFNTIFFGKDCSLNDDYKKTILLYFWGSRKLIDIKYEKNKFKVFFKKEFLNPVNVFHDPEKNESFTVYYDFGSLLNLQAHTFKHCIADYWKNKGSAPAFIEKGEDFFNDFWNGFRKIGCEFCSKFELLDINEREKAKRVFATLENESDNRSIEEIKNGKTCKVVALNWCLSCINKHNGPDTFLKCWELLSKEKIHETYLEKIKAFIEKTISDQKNIELYKGNKTGGAPERRHIHYRKDGDVHIISYALDYKSALDDKSDKKGHVFCLIFKKYRNRYHLKTAYPLIISIKPVTKIYSHAKTKIGNKKILNCCHTSNWTGVKKLLCGN